MATIREVERRAPDCLIPDTVGMTDTRDACAAQAQFEVDLYHEDDNGAVGNREYRRCKKFLRWCEKQGWTADSGWPKDDESKKETGTNGNE